MPRRRERDKNQIQNIFPFLPNPIIVVMILDGQVVQQKHFDEHSILKPNWNFHFQSKGGVVRSERLIICLIVVFVVLNLLPSNELLIGSKPTI